MGMSYTILLNSLRAYALMRIDKIGIFYAFWSNAHHAHGRGILS